MNPKINSITVDEETYRLLKRLANSESDDPTELLKIAGGNLKQLEKYLIETNQIENPEIVAILDRLKGVKLKFQQPYRPQRVRTPLVSGSGRRSGALIFSESKVIKRHPTKSEILASVAEATGINRKDVSAVLEAIGNEIKKAMGSKGSGVFAIPGLVKIEKKKVPARPARKGVPNPFKPGELMDLPAKPASTKIKVRPLKQLKRMA